MMYFKNFEFKKDSLSLVLIFFGLIFFGFISAAGAEIAKPFKIYFEASNSEISVGNDTELSIFLDAPEPINALELEIKYPKNQFQFINSNNARSIIDLWSPKPYILSNGNIGMAGGIFKSFSGSRGLIIKLYFKAIQEGKGEFSFDKANIYLADGKGTKVYTQSSKFPISVIKSVSSSNSLPSVKSFPIFSSEMPNSTPPSLEVSLTHSPLDQSSLITFFARDPESGIKSTQIRIKKWWKFGDWKEVENPVLFPDGAWSVEVKAINNANQETIKTISVPHELYIKLSILLILFIILAFYLAWVYNNAQKKI